jgi:hypothetical protein
MGIFSNVNPIPGLAANLATLTKSAIFMQYETGYNPDGTPVYRPGWESLGSAEKVEMKLTPTWAKVKKQDMAVSLPLAQTITEVEVALSLTLTQQSPLVKALQIMANDPTRKYTQGAVAANSTKTLTGAVPGLVYRLGVKDVTITGVTWGENAEAQPIALVAGTDYQVDRHAGEIYLANKPVAATPGDPIVTFSAPAYDATANLMSLGGFSGTGLRGRFKANGRNVSGLICDVFVWDVLFSSESTVQLQNTSTNYDQVELTGALFPATTDDIGNALGGDDQFFTVIQQSQATLA